jgi:predicted P-loop ATPase
MQNDKTIKIATAAVRTATLWDNQEVLWSTFIENFRTPSRSAETYAEYITLPKNEQDRLKDVGGFVGGWFKDGPRKTKNLMLRTLVTLDLDRVEAGGTEAVLESVKKLGWAYCVYSTRKHQVEAPRLRVIFPLDRECTPQEYEPLARKLGELVGIDWCDSTTFQGNRLMFNPSVCLDGLEGYVYEVGCLELVEVGVDAVLGLYTDWKNPAEWPLPAGADPIVRIAGKWQQDPREKKGIVGAFCRAYDVREAISEFLSEEYIEGERGHYSYVHGSTTGGGKVHDNGLFFYSFHETDPASRVMCNAFDLVRRHKFGHLDEGAEDGFTGDRYQSKSNTAMRAWAGELPEVRELMAEEGRAEFATALGLTVDNADWIKELTFNDSGMLRKTLNNCITVLLNDPNLKGRIRYDVFTAKLTVNGCMPWDKKDHGTRQWGDTELQGLALYLETQYKYRSPQDLKGALKLLEKYTAYNAVEEYLVGLTWDGTPRMQTVFADYLGAENTEYTRDVAMKWFVGAVRRATLQQYQFELIPVLYGRPGDGKTKLVTGLSPEYTLQGFASIHGDRNRAKLSGKWIVELGEMTAVTNSTPEEFNDFATQTKDTRRTPYDTYEQDFSRRCVFIGTTNKNKYLKDYTGGRRFAPVTLSKQPLTKSYKDLKSEVDQIWAEAMHYHRLGVKTYLDREDPLWPQYEEAQGSSREEHMIEPLIMEFLDRDIPDNWYSLSADERKAYLSGTLQGASTTLIKRNKICKQEIWFECLEGSKDRIPKETSQDINSILSNIEGWELNKNPLHFGIYGKIRGYVRE